MIENFKLYLSMENKKMTPVKDYAVKHGFTVQNVYQQIKKGKIKSKRIGSFIFVIEE